GVEEGLRGGVPVRQRCQTPTPETDAEGGLGRGTALVRSEVLVRAEEAVKGTLGGGAGEDGGDHREQIPSQPQGDLCPRHLPEPLPRRIARKVDSTHAVP